jgi:aminopeptidase N
MQKSNLFFLLLSLFPFCLSAQQVETEAEEAIYRGVPEKVNDMVHTKLDAKFDYQKSQLNGKVWLTLKPHVYTVDNLELDAKGMDIHKVQLVGVEKNTPLPYTYDSLKLNIQLGKSFTASQTYTVYIEYTAKPSEFEQQGSSAITDARGLYFIDPKETDPEKPTQIWTQGETEATSVWVPVIDKPNQKSTQEMILTVPNKYVTLSNGKLTGQKKNSDGTRTDTWKMEQPHAPYLFFMGVGEYAIVKDSYKGKEVSYYVEKDYKDVARKIFGDTPEMMKFFSEKLGVEYPWVKYSQIVGRDYVSGAMENTTSTLHGEWAQQNARELTDGNNWENVIAHELFHQWFGDLVTAESWSNLTVNESFANFSERMWVEHKYGKDEGLGVNSREKRGYLGVASDTAKTLVRYYYQNKEDMFDAVSYNKGGCILYMLRDFVGEEAFYLSLKTYLTRNSFGTGNARELQQAFEDTTGKDLNWFFEQWYFRPGHPKLDISYHYDNDARKAYAYVRQTQSGAPYRLPVSIDVYVNDKKQRHFRWIEHRADTFQFDAVSKPQLINVDADKVLLAQKNDHKTLEEYVFQYHQAGNYEDRYESLDFASKQLDNPAAIAFVRSALKDTNYRFRLKALTTLQMVPVDKPVLDEVLAMAKTDPKRLVRAESINLLAIQKSPQYQPLFVASLKDSSYTVAGAALSALIDLDDPAATSALPELKKDAKGALAIAIDKAEVLTKTDADFDGEYSALSALDLNGKYQHVPNFALYLSRVNDVEKFKKGVGLIISIRDQILPYYGGYKNEVDELLSGLRERVAKKSGESVKEQLKILDEAMGN